MESRYETLRQVLDMPAPIIDLIDVVAGPRIQTVNTVPATIKPWLREYRKNLSKNLTEAEWKQSCIDRYNPIMFDINSTGGFKSWKRYYAYLEVMFTARPEEFETGDEEGIPAGVKDGDIVYVKSGGRRGLVRRYMYAGGALIEAERKIPVSLHILSKVPLHYFDDTRIDSLPFNAYDLGLYLDWADVEMIETKFCVTFYHQNIGYCIAFDKEKHVVLFNYTVYISSYKRITKNKLSKTTKSYRPLVEYVQKEYRITPEHIFLLDEDATRIPSDK